MLPAVACSPGLTLSLFLQLTEDDASSWGLGSGPSSVHDLIGQLIYSGEHESTDQNNQAVEKLNSKKDNRPYNMGIAGTDELNNKQNMLSEL